MPVRLLPCPVCKKKSGIEFWFQREGGEIWPEDIRQDCDCELTEEQEKALVFSLVKQEERKNEGW